MSGLHRGALIIRSAAPGEAESLGALALRSKAHWGYSREFLEACRKELSYSAEQVERSGWSFVVAEDAGVVVGFYAVRRLSATESELEALFVEPAHIGQGIGRALMDHAKVAAANVGARSLVIQGDPHAESFYRAAGGFLIGQRESNSIPGRYLPIFAISLNDAEVE